MTGHVAERPGAEIPPAAPVVRVIDRVVRPLGRRPQEKVPVNVRRNRHRLLRTRDDVRRLLPVVERAIGPDVNFLHLAERPGSHQLDRAAEAGIGRALVAHLGANLFLRAVSRISRASHTECASGFWQ